jgi:hypothetical protein
VTRQARDPILHLAALLAPGGPSATVPASGGAWGPVLDAASRHGLVPALWSALRSSGAVQPVPEQLAGQWRKDPRGRVPVEVALASTHRRNLDHVNNLCQQASEILHALDAADIRAVPLKGVDAVFSGRYVDPGARTMVDADILVDPESVDEAEAVVGRLGYRPVPAPASTHQLAPVVRPGQAGSVELHRALAVERWADIVDPAAVLDRSSPAPGGRRQASRTDSAVHLVAHAQLHDEGYLLWRLPLRAVHETALMLSGAEEVDWDEVARAFSRVRRRAALVAHLDMTARLFALRSPLSGGRSWGYRPRATVRLDRHPSTLHLLDEIVWLPRTLSPARMAELYAASDRPSIRRARIRHVRRALLRRLRLARVRTHPGEGHEPEPTGRACSNGSGPNG